MTRERTWAVRGVALSVVFVGIVGVAAADPKLTSRAAVDGATVPTVKASVVPLADRQARRQVRAIERKLEDANRQIAASSGEVKLLRESISNYEVKLLRESISDYKDLTLLGIAGLALLLAVIGVILPLQSFFSSRKVTREARAAVSASQSAANDARKVIESLEGRFRDLNKMVTNERIDAAITRLASSNLDEVTQGISILQVTPDLALTEDQIRRICEAATDVDRVLAFLPFVRHAPSVHAQHLIQTYLGQRTPRRDQLIQLAAEQAEHQQAVDFRRWVMDDWLVKQPGSLVQVVRAASVRNGAFLSALTNDDAFLAKFPLEIRQQALSHLHDMMRQNPAISKIVGESLLTQQFAGDVYVLKDKNGGETEDPSQAERVIPYTDSMKGKGAKKGESEFVELLEKAIAAKHAAIGRGD